MLYLNAYIQIPAYHYVWKITLMLRYSNRTFVAPRKDIPKCPRKGWTGALIHNHLPKCKQGAAQEQIQIINHVRTSISLANVEVKGQQPPTAVYTLVSTSALLLPWCKSEDPSCCFPAAHSSCDSGECFTLHHWTVTEILLRMCKMALNRWWKFLPYIRTHIRMYTYMCARFKTTHK